MKMCFRWFGEGVDHVDLWKIRQIPGLYGVVTSLMDIPAGEKWPLERLLSVRKKIEDECMRMPVIESYNVHEDIKLGLPSRDRYLENFRDALRVMGRSGVEVLCYNFMPVFDWTRSDLAMRLPDGSEVFAYDKDRIEGLSPLQIVERMQSEFDGFAMPGWEPERLAELKRLFALYEGVDSEALFRNFEYFLKAVVPVAEEAGVKLAVHPDDPPWPIFGLPRIVSRCEDLERIVSAVDSPCNGLTLCSGSLGSRRDNDIPSIVRRFASRGKIHFAHIRNVRIDERGNFHESSHLSSDGSLDLFEIVKAYHDCGYEGFARPDHGRMIWGEKGRPGYGLYDRALGIAYINGLWEAIGKMKRASGAAK
jgi:mannonate dehydratase